MSYLELSAHQSMWAPVTALWTVKCLYWPMSAEKKLLWPTNYGCKHKHFEGPLTICSFRKNNISRIPHRANDLLRHGLLTRYITRHELLPWRGPYIHMLISSFPSTVVGKATFSPMCVLSMFVKVNQVAIAVQAYSWIISFSPYICINCSSHTMLSFITWNQAYDNSSIAVIVEDCFDSLMFFMFLYKFPIFFFYSCDYNTITLFPLSLSSFQTLQCSPPCCLSNSRSFFH